MQYLALIMAIGMLYLSFIEVYSITAGRTYKYNRKIVPKNSIFRKVFLRKDKEFELLYVTVVPFLVNAVLCAIIFSICLVYWIFGSDFCGMLLSSVAMKLFLPLWYIAMCIYYGIIGP